jgi:hypothetical protein
MSCEHCHGFGTVGVPPNAKFCDCADGRAARTHPELGEKWLAFVNGLRSGGADPLSRLRRRDEAKRTTDSLERIL